MIGKLLIASVIVSQVSLASSCINPKILDQEVDTIANKIWIGKSISPQEIKMSLSFVTKLDPSKLERLPNSIEDTCNEATLKIQQINSVQGKHFMIFASQCHDLYNKSKDDSFRFGLSKLFDSVSKKLLGEAQKVNLHLKTENGDHFASSMAIFSDRDSSELLFKNFFDTVKSH
ncbi:MAG: hypothetical protein BGO77_08455 [Caedibacter sp. 37-49]|nr:MAG: hypothetical protein BGO77_08455 [Caedibacter sp. 37-49]